jgi:hypothetical protein
MDKSYIVFGGWGFSPDILRPVFGDKSHYVDVNKLMPLLFHEMELLTNWLDIIHNHVSSTWSGNQLHVAGWSTGAIIAAALSSNIEIDSLVLLSATPSFCRVPGFPYGQRPGVLKKMREELEKSDNTVVKQFVLQCGLPESELPGDTNDSTSLQQGLCFLEAVNLLGMTSLSDNKIIFHGAEDNIIPASAGKYFSSQINAEYHEYSGGHVFFQNNVKKIQGILG